MWQMHKNKHFPFFISRDHRSKRIKDNPHVIEHCKKMLEEFGSGLSSARFICGTQSIHKVHNHSKEVIHHFFYSSKSINFGRSLSSLCHWMLYRQELERKLSAFHGREDTILYASCFDANTGLFEAILTPDDAVFSDELNHASIIDGIRLCKAQKHRYLHYNMQGNIQGSL